MYEEVVDVPGVTDVPDFVVVVIVAVAVVAIVGGGGGAGHPPVGTLPGVVMTQRMFRKSKKTKEFVSKLARTNSQISGARELREVPL